MVRWETNISGPSDSQYVFEGFLSELFTVIKNTETELNRWMNLPLSLVGRISCIKMNVLPKFLFLFQMLPTVVHKYFFKQLHSAVSRFIWKGKIPRIRLKILQGTPQEGGLKLPNFETYYWAAQCLGMESKFTTTPLLGTDGTAWYVFCVNPICSFTQTTLHADNKSILKTHL